jgi:hypothetical protein
LRSDRGGDLARRRIEAAARFYDLSRCAPDIADLREAGLGD